MNYLYDVLINFTDKKCIYEYFDWVNSDYVVNVKRVLLFKVDYKTLFNLYNYKVKISKKFLKNINSSFLNKKINVRYLFVITNGGKSIALGVNDSGVVDYKSNLSYEDEDYANRVALSLKTTTIDYKVLDSNYNDYVLRDDKSKKDYLLKVFNNSYNNKEFDKLKYYFLEVYDKQESDDKEMLNQLINGLSTDLSRYDSIYKMLKNTSSSIEK